VTYELAASVSALGPSWLDPQKLPDTFGGFAFWAAMIIIFAECGVLIGLFLPGDSLLFIVGLLIAGGQIKPPGGLVGACALLSVAAVIGNLTGYGIGYQVGPRLFRREDSRLFKQSYVDRTHDFFDRHGSKAIVLGRFVPIVRTFITAVAGVGRMDFRRYAAYSAIGGILWAAGMTLLGYWLGDQKIIKNNIELITIGIVVLSVLPLVIHWLRERRRSRTAGATDAA
jgi:membrane-associated protein